MIRMEQGKWYWSPESPRYRRALFFFDSENENSSTVFGEGFVFVPAADSYIIEYYSRGYWGGIDQLDLITEASQEEVEKIKYQYILQEL